MNTAHDLPYSVARLRQGAVAFFTTKGLTAPLSVLIFLLISTRLPTPEFALYAWLVAFGQMSEWLSYLGLNWVAVHYIPHYRSRIGGRAYVRFVWGLVGLRYGLLAVLVAVCFIVAPDLLDVFGQPDWLHPLHLFLVVMSADLAVKFLRTGIFEPLLRHGAAQRNVLLQHVVVLALLVALSTDSSLTIEQVLYARIAATGVAWLAAFVGLARLLRQPAIGHPDALAPRARTLLGFALDNYMQDLVRILSDGPMVTLLASRLVGVAGLALFGFAGNLTEFLNRVLPTTLFLGLLRPRFIADYGSDRQFERLRGHVALLLKISMTSMAAVAAVLVSVGRPALGLLAGGRYSECYSLLLLFLMWLGFSSLRNMQGVLANVLGHSSFLRRAAISSLLVVPAAVILVSGGAGAHGLVLGMILGEALSVLLMTRQLRQRGYDLPLDVPGYVRIVGAACAGGLVGRVALLLLPATAWSVGLSGVLTVGSFAFAIRALRPFEAWERTAIESVVGRRLVFL